MSNITPPDPSHRATSPPTLPIPGRGPSTMCRLRGRKSSSPHSCRREPQLLERLGDLSFGGEAEGTLVRHEMTHPALLSASRPAFAGTTLRLSPRFPARRRGPRGGGLLGFARRGQSLRPAA